MRRSTKRMLGYVLLCTLLLAGIALAGCSSNSTPKASDLSSTDKADIYGLILNKNLQDFKASGSTAPAQIAISTEYSSGSGSSAEVPADVQNKVSDSASSGTIKVEWVQPTNGAIAPIANGAVLSFSAPEDTDNDQIKVTEDMTVYNTNDPNGNATKKIYYFEKEGKTWKLIKTENG